MKGERLTQSGLANYMYEDLGNVVHLDGHYAAHVKKSMYKALLRRFDGDVLKIARFLGDSPQRTEALILAYFPAIKLKNSVAQKLRDNVLGIDVNNNRGNGRVVVK
ncbi:MAG: hypothetical protein HRT87_05420 [Legionellales bacterium]|nr:hypothetical protein [Legionellales bacterium]